MLSGARTRGIVGIVGKVIRIHALRNPVRLACIGSVALDRAVNDELDSSCFVPSGIVGFHNIIEVGQVGATDPVVTVDINGETVSEALVDCGAERRHGQILGSGDSTAEVSIDGILNLGWGEGRESG